jgi:hypothetical protein
MKKRKVVEAYIIDAMGKIDKSGINAELYRNVFKNMTDNEFDHFMHTLKEGDSFVSIFVPPDGDVDITVENNFKVAKELGIEFLQNIQYDDKRVSAVKTSVLWYNFRRLKQTTAKGSKVHSDMRKRNVLTNTVVWDSAGGGLSLPEIDVLIAYGLTDTVKELIGPRGGDAGANRAMLRDILDGKEVNLDEVMKESTSRESKNVLKAMYKAMHIDLSI